MQIILQHVFILILSCFKMEFEKFLISNSLQEANHAGTNRLEIIGIATVLMSLVICVPEVSIILPKTTLHKEVKGTQFGRKK